MGNNIFELVSNDYNLIVLKVNVKSNLDIAMNPYIDGNMDYISVTRGSKHILTIIYKDGHTFDFYWGNGGYTLIGENLKTLKSKVVDFIENQCHLLLGLNTEPTSAKIFYNDNYKSWQMTVNRDGMIWNDEAKSAEDMMNWANNYIKVKCWKREIAPTGIDVWKAVF